ncbi:MAG TPA: hypothetical protein DCG87_00390, partial [Synergistaceae bacterium]|nr:hypothetical protein [Synergistaceae bacterium]
SILDEIRASEKAQGQDRIFVHGEKERMRRMESLEKGVPLDEKTWEEMVLYSQRFRLDLPVSTGGK